MYWDFYNRFQPNKDTMLKIYTATFKEKNPLNIQYILQFLIKIRCFRRLVNRSGFGQQETGC